MLVLKYDMVETPRESSCCSITSNLTVNCVRNEKVLLNVMKKREKEQKGFLPFNFESLEVITAKEEIKEKQTFDREAIVSSLCMSYYVCSQHLAAHV